MEVKEIPLTQGQVAMVDDEDFEELSKHKWCIQASRGMNYAKRKVFVDGKPKMLVMHRAIMGIPPDGYVIDHIDGNGVNNQRSNLRFCTPRQNYQNRHCVSSSKYPGVSWSKKTKKWASHIRINKDIKNLGSYYNEIDAFRAYYDAVLALGQEILDFPYPYKIRKGIYLLLGASGSGKTTLSQQLKDMGIPELISHSTRPMRDGESEENPYYFVAKQEFDSIDFVETTQYANNWYGTSKSEVDRVLSSGGSAFAIVDRHGVEEFKSIYGESVKVVFVYVSPDKVFDRMLVRGDKLSDVHQRVTHAERTGEYNNLDIADYCIINNDLDDALRQLRAIVVNG